MTCWSASPPISTGSPKTSPRAAGPSDEIVDYIWKMMSDRLFYVTMEYLPEARHNEEIQGNASSRGEEIPCRP